MSDEYAADSPDGIFHAHSEPSEDGGMLSATVRIGTGGTPQSGAP